MVVTVVGIRVLIKQVVAIVQTNIVDTCLTKKKECYQLLVLLSCQ